MQPKFHAARICPAKKAEVRENEPLFRPEIYRVRSDLDHSWVGSVCAFWIADHKIAKLQGERGGQPGVVPRSIFLPMSFITPRIYDNPLYLW